MKWPLHRISPSVPQSDSVAAFGHRRSYYFHPGVDLYCAENTYVVACEAGRIVNIEEFTGTHATPPSPWWNTTYSILIEGKSGVLGYCELHPAAYLKQDMTIEEGDFLGTIIPVLKRDKGNGTTMLHFEQYVPGTFEHVTWHHEEPRPASLVDPTDFLRKVAIHE